MNEQRQRQYLNLIQSLLNCPQGEEPAILQANQELLDEGLVQTMVAVAAKMSEEGEENNARWLLNVAEKLAEMLGLSGEEDDEPATPTPETYLTFLQKLFKAQYESNDNPQVIHRLLADNLDKLDKNFASVLLKVAADIIAANPEKAEGMVALIENLCVHISNFPLGNIANNIEIAIAGYKFVLERRQEDKEKWAQTQNNLGIAYSDRISGDRAENLEKAIKAYRLALEVRTKNDFPIDWAQTQNNLGAAYLYRISGDRAENLEKAIEVYQLALEVRTKNDFPIDWAMIQNNLSIAYSERIRDDRAENLEKAIESFQLALLVYTKKDFSIQWAQTQNNLGNAYLYRIRHCRAENLEKAIESYQLALEVRTKKDFPQDWATTQHNLGIAYSERIRDDRAENLEKAIAAYQNALLVYTKEAFPTDWAMTQNNLGAAYRKAGNQKKAIAAYRLALTETTPKTLPLDCLRTAGNLCNLGFQQGNWQLAIEGYEQAIQAVEQTRNWISDDTRRQEVLRESIYIFEKAIQAYINNDQLEKALETVERFRCKGLVDLMATKDLYADGNLSPDVAEWVEKYEAKQRQIDLLRSQLQSGGQGDDKARSYRTRDEWEEINEKIEELIDEKQKIWKQLRSLDPVLAEGQEVPPLDVAKMRRLLGEDGEVALLSFYTTRSDTLVFILRQDGIQLHTCQGQGLEELQRWLFDNWFLPYARKLKADWESRMEEILAALAKRLQLEELVEKLSGVKELILVPHLYLHQIPLAALPVGEPDKGEYWGGKFSIRTIASSQVLDFCSQRGQPKERQTYGIVENPTEDLAFTPIECDLVAKLYDVEPRHHLKNAAATKEKYRQLLRGEKIQGLLSSHHAKSNLSQPSESVLILADGRLTLGELLSPSWRLPDLKDLFLSCCETGLGDSNLTDDIFTLAAGFLCAGAINVVSTLWSVNDLATAILSYYYHKNRLDGLNRPQALWQAQMQLKNLTEEEALANLDNAEAVLDELEEGSREYDSWEKEADCRNVVYNLVVKAKELLGGEKPFDRPYYWSGFLCQGLR